MMNRILSAGPISKRLVSFQFTPAKQIQLIKEMLADRGGQEAAKVLERGDASKLIELLDSVCLPFSFLVINALRPQVLRADRLVPLIRPTCIRYLARVCEWHILLPESAKISGHKPEVEIGGGGYSTVWSGSHNSQKVAIKVLAVYEGDDDARKKEIRRVSWLATVRWQQSIDVCPHVV